MDCGFYQHVDVVFEHCFARFDWKYLRVPIQTSTAEDRNSLKLEL